MGVRLKSRYEMLMVAKELQRDLASIASETMVPIWLLTLQDVLSQHDPMWLPRPLLI